MESQRKRLLRMIWVLLAILVMQMTVMHMITRLYFPASLTTETLDVRFLYSSEDVRTTLDAFGEEGRLGYRLLETVDTTFLTAYTMFIFVLARYCKARRSVLQNGRAVLSAGEACFYALPGLFDLLETSGILILLSAYPHDFALVRSIVSYATPVKWTTGVFVAIRLIRELVRSRSAAD